jgi:hypothetical protein
MCGPLLGGFWWVFPLVGFVVCLAFTLTAFRCGRGGARMHVHGRPPQHAE